MFQLFLILSVFGPPIPHQLGAPFCFSLAYCYSVTSVMFTVIYRTGTDTISVSYLCVLAYLQKFPRKIETGPVLEERNSNCYSCWQVLFTGTSLGVTLGQVLHSQLLTTREESPSLRYPNNYTSCNLKFHVHSSFASHSTKLRNIPPPPHPHYSTLAFSCVYNVDLGLSPAWPESSDLSAFFIFTKT